MKIIIFIAAITGASFSYAQDKIYVSTSGNDQAPGSVDRPLKTISAALRRAGEKKNKDVDIYIRAGSYSLDSTINIRSDAYELRSLSIGAYPGEKVDISGAIKIKPDWQPYKNGILKAYLDLKEAPDQLFLSGKSLNMARYPNFDVKARVYHGTAADAFSNERARNWKNPAGGYMHALHEGEWGDFHYLITGKDAGGNLQYEGGWQNNRPAKMHDRYRFVENIFEELDAPGEWFYDRKTKTMYLYPPEGVDVRTADLSVSRLTDLIHIHGTQGQPVRNITIRGIAFTQTARTFMLVKEPLLRSDWRIYRGGAILLEGTENVHIRDCAFSELGGNAVFLSNYNKNDTVSGNHFYQLGGNAIAFAGNPDDVRSPSFRYELFVPWNEMDYTPGPKGEDHPQYCSVIDNLIHNTGTIEKQTAGIEISMSAHIYAGHNTIYQVPRAGINISEGTWGGHMIEFNEVFNTVLETGDHGAFNSWGRDRYWRPERDIIDSIVAAKPGIELLDVIDPIVLRNNIFQCDHGWDIDLDDGSTNYEICNNICLSGGLKLREGYHRIVRNNIILNNTFHPHVWLKNSHDQFVHNVITLPYAPILMNNWGDRIDSNFFLSEDALTKARKLGIDKNSTWGKWDPGRLNIVAGAGVTKKELKAIAAKPVINPLFTAAAGSEVGQVQWLGAFFKDVQTLGEQSAAGLPDRKGALLIRLPPGSAAEKNGLRQGDVIRRLGSRDINSADDILQAQRNKRPDAGIGCVIFRNQSQRTLVLH